MKWKREHFGRRFLALDAAPRRLPQRKSDTPQSNAPTVDIPLTERDFNIDRSWQWMRRREVVVHIGRLNTQRRAKLTNIDNRDFGDRIRGLGRRALRLLTDSISIGTSATKHPQQENHRAQYQSFSSHLNCLLRQEVQRKKTIRRPLAES